MTKLLLVALLAAACTKAEPAHNAPAPGPVAPAQLQTMTVDEVDTSLAKGEVQPVDVNGDTTRHREGVLPGAVLLTDDDAYQVTELPADKAKSLVFYCANMACSSSHHAAQKALAAGYQHVHVMPDGIAGWIKAGKQTQKI